MVYEIYELRKANGRKFSWERYSIMDTFTGRFIEWEDLPKADYGDKEINQQLSCSGSVVVSKSQAELIVRKLKARGRLEF